MIATNFRAAVLLLVSACLASAQMTAPTVEPHENSVSEAVLSLPKDLPDTFALELPFQGRKWILHFEKSSVFGENTRFLVPDDSGKLAEVDPGFDCAYFGRVEGCADFMVGAVLTERGLIANIVRPGRESITVEPVWNGPDTKRHRVFVGNSGDQEICQDARCRKEVAIHDFPVSQAGDSDETAASNEPITTSFEGGGSGNLSASSTATLPPARVMDVLQFEVGVEIGSRAYIDNYGSNLASAQAAAASIAANMDARYLRGAGIKHVLGTVIIRTNAGTDPLRNTVTGITTPSLEAFRNYWNGNPGEVGTTHDLAVYHVRASPSGLAYVNSVGTSSRYALSCSNGPTSWADGTLVHEFGHSWNLRHNNAAPIVEYDYASGDPPPSLFYEAKPRNNSGSNTAGGNHDFVSVMNGSGTHNIGRLATDEANTVYATRESKRSYGTVVANPGQIPPFGHRDVATVTKGSSVTIDVVANDFDSNNDVLDVVVLDSVSQKGGTIALSAGTGPGGRNRLVYTPPAAMQGDTDFFHYTVCDPNGGKDFGAVYVTVEDALLFSESFLYPAGTLAGASYAGNLWIDNEVGGSTTVATSARLTPSSPAAFASAGGKVTQTGSDRMSLALPAAASGGANGTVRYISFLQKLSFGVATKSQVVEFWNGSATTDNTAFSFGTDTWAGAPDYGLFIDKNGGNIALDVGSPDTNAHLIVLKVVFGANNADSISVFVDPGATEPAVPLASSSFTNLAFNRVGFSCFQGGGQEVDEIRIGATYRSVVPQEVPKRFFEESFSYVPGNLVGKANDGNAWADEFVGGSTTVAAGGSINVPGPAGFVRSGDRAAQVDNDRVSLALSAEASSGADYSVRYISFVQKLGFGVAGKTQIVEFWDSVASSATTAFSFGTDTHASAPDYGLLIDKGGDNVPLALGSPDTDAHLIVFKVEYGPANADAISVYIDPGENEPATPDALAFRSNLGFNRFSFGSFQGGAQEVDEIRIGATFSDVVPLSASGLLFEETFPYAAGDLAGNSKDGNPWTDNYTGGSTAVSSDASLAYPGFASADGRVSQTGSDRNSLALSTDASGGQDGSVRYISFIQKLGFADAGKSQVVEFWNGPATTNNTAFSFGTDAWPGSPDYGLFIDKNGGNVPLSVGSPDTDSHLIVIKIQYGAGDADTLEVFLDPGASEPPTASASTSFTNLAFNRIGFGAFQGGAQQVDEIRIGTTYADVVPIYTTDSDGDGLPDDFERAYYHPTDLTVTDGSDDLDHDGMSDGDEFRAGTDPTDPTSLFRITGIDALTETDFTIVWDSVAGMDYAIWSSSDLATGGWTKVLASKVATGPVTSATVSKSGARGFFRISVNQ